MKKRKIIAPMLAAAAILATVFGLNASASFGQGVSVMAEETEIVKTGIFGKKLVFSDTDFKQGLAITDFDSIIITKLPSSREGTLLLAGRRVSEGMKIRRKNIGSLVFIPSDNSVAESKFYFTISPYADENEIEFKIRFTDKINYEPTLSDSAEASILTQRDITIYGKLMASDGEGDDVSYMVVSYPKYGFLEFLDGENGKFRYTPLKGYVGEDEFSYVARDEWGNFSTPGKISISVSERMSEVVYKDMQGNENYNAAVALSAMGIMDGKIIGDGVYFMPDEKITRAEFVSMLMKALDLKIDSSDTETFFDDNDAIPKGLVPYVAAAERLGLITGEFTRGKFLFNPNEKITTCEAASIIRRALGDKIKLEIPVNLETSLPDYAEEDAYVLSTIGIFDSDITEIKLDDIVTKEACAAYLYKLIKCK